MELTLAEGVLLLALDDARGSTGSTPVDPGLAGALLVDLGRFGALQPEGKALHPVDGAAIEHPVLARAYTAIATSSKPRSAKAWVGRLPRELKPLIGTVAGPLVERGAVAEQRVKVLGLFPSTRFPEVDPGPERALRSRLREVLLGTRVPQEYDALLLGLLDPLGLVDPLVERPHRREARKHAKEIADRGIAGKAVSDAVRDIHAAVATAVIVPVIVSSGG
ncbi:MAG: GOLPH3/VPS74 family protein [Pseudonocardiaceae bacterium]